MTESIRTLTFRWVNAYLAKSDAGFVLIDTGMAGNRAALERELRDAGCAPGDLRLILITHGDPTETLITVAMPPTCERSMARR